MLKQILMEWGLKQIWKKNNVDPEYNVETYLKKIPEYFDATKAGQRVGDRRLVVVYEFHDSGSNDGLWTVIIDGGKCTLEKGETAPYETKMLLTADTYRRILSGKLDFARLAYSTGAVRFFGNSLGHRELNEYIKLPKDAGVAAL